MFKDQYLKYLGFLAFSLLVSIGCQILIPWPFGFIAAMGFFIGFPMLLKNRMIQKGAMSYMDTAKVEYHCTACGVKHNRDSCPRCGSRMKKANF